MGYSRTVEIETWYPIKRRVGDLRNPAQLQPCTEYLVIADENMDFAAGDFRPLP